MQGQLWAMVVSMTSAATTQVLDVKSGNGAVGLANFSIMGMSITTLQSQKLLLSSCRLRYATTYTAAIYVEDLQARGDGRLVLVQFNTPPGVSNTFLQLPLVTGTVTSNNVSFIFMSTTIKNH